MDCKHERMRAVGNRIFCCSCNAEVTDEFNASLNAQEPVKNPSDDAKANKPTSKKRTAKKAV